MPIDDGLYDDDAQPEWHSERRRGHDWANDPDRRLSLTVPCRHCTAPVDVVCRNLAGHMGTKLAFADAPEVAHIPAHPIRLTDARRGPKPL